MIDQDVERFFEERSKTVGSGDLQDNFYAEVVNAELARIRTQVALMCQDLEGFRRLLWRWHGCPDSALSQESGQLYCERCLLDFRVADAAVVATRFRDIGFAQKYISQELLTEQDRARGREIARILGLEGPPQ
jgi:hypothetical protein